MFRTVLWRPHGNRILLPSLQNVGFSTTSPTSLLLPSQRLVFVSHGTKQDNERRARLMVHVEEARQPRARSSYRTAVKTEERLGPDGTFRCTSCKILKGHDSFYFCSRYKYEHSPMCKTCKREEKRHYYGYTLRGVMKRLLHSAKSRASRRSKMPLREEAGHFELTMDSLLNLWQKQQGRCEYSGLVMSLDPFTSWRLSLERLENSLGYVPGNVVFICLEFNTSDHTLKVKNGLATGSSQWSKSKLQSLPEVIDHAAPLSLSHTELYKMLLVEKVPEKKKRASKRVISPSGLLLCTSCGEVKSADTDFHANTQSHVGKRNWCKSCVSVRSSVYTKSFSGFLRSRLSSARYCARVRTKKGRFAAGEFSLTMDDILNMYQLQRGLCFYSGVRLFLQPHSEWMCSIERFDNDKGYVRSNVALICAEFQSSDYSHHAKAPVKGSAQWSREKVDMLVHWLRVKHLP